ncbi:MAG: SLC13 family permease [Rhodothermales bacterium]|nr:SLC13 family permease [Rhodothermales bacterium]
MLGWQAWVTLGVIVLMVVALARDIARPDLILLGSLGLLLVVGIVTPTEAFAGFSNSAVLSVGALFIVAQGLQRTGALVFLDTLMFSKSTRPLRHLPRLMLPTSFMSAFLNNTPIVAMVVPRLQRWAERKGVASSRVMIPLSYAAILGGMMTLIGTSTNIVVSGLMETAGLEPMGMFEITWIGLPAALAVALYFAVAGHRLLPDRTSGLSAAEDGLKDCFFEVRVSDDSLLAGKTVEEAELRNLVDAFLVHVRRGQRFIPVRPQMVLEAGDILSFTGKAEMIDRLLDRPGLERALPAPGTGPGGSLPIFEAVVAESSSLVGHTLRDLSFRERYRGVVLAIQRKNEQLSGSLGRIRIRPGDLLLIEAEPNFAQRWNSSRTDFYLVAPRAYDRSLPSSQRAPVALAILIGMVALVATDILPIVTASFAAALGMILTRCLNFGEAKSSVDVSVLLVIAAALGIGKAVEVTGLAQVSADLLVGSTAAFGPVALLASIYLATNVLTELITHKAAAVLMFPVAVAAALELGFDPRPFAFIVAIGAAASFVTPIGYQTNLMVMAAGGYRYRDYLKAGLPVALIVMAIALSIAVSLWL